MVGWQDYVVPLDGVGGTLIYARADVFRSGALFPSYLVNHQVETEGFAQMALQRGFKVLGLPNLVITHA
jgi:mannan polymerase complexes MNN9 subunit